MSPDDFPSVCGNFFSEPSAQAWAQNCLHDAPSPSLNSHSESQWFTLLPRPMQLGQGMRVEEENSTSESQQQVGEELAMIEASLGSVEEGCRCSKINCQKNYCSCFKSGKLCTEKCRCRKCKSDGRKKHLFCLSQEFMLNFFDFKHNFHLK